MLNRLSIVDEAELARNRRKLFVWAFAAELVWFVMGVFVGAKWGIPIAEFIRGLT